MDLSAEVTIEHCTHSVLMKLFASLTTPQHWEKIQRRGEICQSHDQLEDYLESVSQTNIQQLRLSVKIVQFHNISYSFKASPKRVIYQDLYVKMNSSDVCGPIPPEFVLIGLSWINGHQTLAALVFLVMYLMAIVANCSIITIVKMDRKLHEPMHVFICFLALIDLSLCSSVIPKSLAVLWFSSNTISNSLCLVQMYVLYAMLGTQSSLFALMSFDRYVAICHPLRHCVIMSSSFMVKSVLFIISRSTLLLIPIPAMAAHMTYSKVNVISHSYCEYIEIIKLWCGGLTSSVIYMIVLIFLFPGGDNMLVIFSYVNILNVIHRLQSSQARWKSLSTCSSHATVLSLF
ncbi:PREDICTED: olfactory receptor 51E1-like [Nanorana parkeri]|uniref:olfactory receptor 51E1-like n=1 Tax=Nanorana parkeri TaxID=125878 RepID=UPI0008547457|nr:PREDICTED: olfactory receptor 51E1-like [Nanorana parkeri]